jgi:glycolate oxidase iron-sulfur subunit
MHTELSAALRDDPDAQATARLISACVHCGFCTATCPSYQILGNELDSPRGRIYLVKELLEGVPASRDTQVHLDRCLTCRACETTCPSGVQYGAIVEAGRARVDAELPRPFAESLQRKALVGALASPLFAPALRVGQALRPLLPAGLQAKVPERRPAGEVPRTVHSRRVLLLKGCVQPSMSPGINAATRRVLDRLGVQAIELDGCCGALRAHTGQPEAAHADMRRLSQRAAPQLDSVEAVISNASGCGVMVKDYAHALPGEAEPARVAAATQDLGEYLFNPAHGFVPKLTQLLGQRKVPKLAYHPPCTLQHGQKLKGGVEAGLRALGFEVQLPAESHLCCGSAGTYSVLQPEIAQQLRSRKVTHLLAHKPDVIASANIGCIAHLQGGCATPVRHWIEVLDEALALPAWA